MCPIEVGASGLEHRSDADPAVGCQLGLERDRFGRDGLSECGELSLGEIPRVLQQLGVIEVEETERVVAIENLFSATVEWNQRCRRIEDAAEVICDPRPAAEDVAFQSRAAQDLAGAETITGFEGDAGFIPR